MNTAVRIVRVLATLAIAVLLAWGAMVLSGEAVVAWYMQHYGVAHRAELADDMGFGMLDFVVESLAAMLTFVTALFVGWRLSARGAHAAGLTLRIWTPQQVQEIDR